jgi:hypothetical protein
MRKGPLRTTPFAAVQRAEDARPSPPCALLTGVVGRADSGVF